MQTMMKLSIQHLVIQHLQDHHNQMKITIILSQVGNIVSHLQTTMCDKQFRFLNNVDKSFRTSNMIHELHSYNIFYNNDNCDMFEFSDFKSLIKYL